MRRCRGVPPGHVNEPGLFVHEAQLLRPMIPRVSAVRDKASTTTSASGSAASSPETDTVCAAPGTELPERLTTVASTSKGASNSRNDRAMPPPPRMVTR